MSKAKEMIFTGNKYKARFERLGVAGIHLQHIEADAFGCHGVVQQPVPMGLLQCRRDAGVTDRLECGNGPRHVRFPRSKRTNFTNGS